MDITARLDTDVVAVNARHRLSVFVELTAPPAPQLSAPLDGVGPPGAPSVETAYAASILLRRTRHVRDIRVLPDLAVTATADGLCAEFGSLYARERRTFTLVLDIGELPTPGLTLVATIELTYVEPLRSRKHTIGVPIHVTVALS